MEGGGGTVEVAAVGDEPVGAVGVSASKDSVSTTGVISTGVVILRALTSLK